MATVTEVKYKSEFESTNDTPYLALRDELWGVVCEDFEENWLYYDSTALYHVQCHMFLMHC